MPEECMVARPPTKLEKLRRSFTMEFWESKFSKWLGKEHHGMPGPPGNEVYMEFGPPVNRQTRRPMHVAAFIEDGHQLWIGHPDGWYWHCDKYDARRVAFFVIWHWIRWDWFGLRSWLWFKLLSRRCARWDRQMTLEEEDGGWMVESTPEHLEPRDEGEAS